MRLFILSQVFKNFLTQVNNVMPLTQFPDVADEGQALIQAIERLEQSKGPISDKTSVGWLTPEGKIIWRPSALEQGYVSRQTPGLRLWHGVEEQMQALGWPEVFFQSKTILKTTWNDRHGDIPLGLNILARTEEVAGEPTES